MIRIRIDTSDNKEVSVALEKDGKETVMRENVGARKAQEVLPLLDRLLSESKLSLKDITEIEVNTGPGSFTGLRVGVSIANTLGYLLKIPINGMPVGKFAEPVYSK